MNLKVALLEVLATTFIDSTPSERYPARADGVLAREIGSAR